MNNKLKFNNWFKKKKRLTLDELEAEFAPMTIEQRKAKKAGGYGGGFGGFGGGFGNNFGGFNSGRFNNHMSTGTGWGDRYMNSKPLPYVGLPNPNVSSNFGGSLGKSPSYNPPTYKPQVFAPPPVYNHNPFPQYIPPYVPPVQTVKPPLIAPVSPPLQYIPPYVSLVQNNVKPPLVAPSPSFTPPPVVPSVASNKLTTPINPLLNGSSVDKNPIGVGVKNPFTGVGSPSSSAKPNIVPTNNAMSNAATGSINGTLTNKPIDFLSNLTLHFTNTQSVNTAAYKTISERNDYYKWVDKQVEGKSKWFKAADIVTRSNAVGAADKHVPNLNYLNDDADRFLREGNKYLFSYNMNNAKAIMDGTLNSSFVDANGELVSFNGVSNIKTFFGSIRPKLDYALVQFEQTKVQHFIGEYKKNNPGADMQSIMKSVNGSFEKTNAAVEFVKNNHLKAIMKEKFNDGKSFDFNNYDHRVTLGKALIDRLHAE